MDLETFVLELVLRPSREAGATFSAKDLGLPISNEDRAAPATEAIWAIGVTGRQLSHITEGGLYDLVRASRH